MKDRGICIVFITVYYNCFITVADNLLLCLIFILNILEISKLRVWYSPVSGVYWLLGHIPLWRRKMDVNLPLRAISLLDFNCLHVCFQGPEMLRTELSQNETKKTKRWSSTYDGAISQ